MKKSMEGFDAVVDKAIGDFKVPGLAIAVVKDGEVIYARGFGNRDVEKGLPVTPRTLFAIGSCTKAFTTFVMGTLVDEGKLDWDTPVRTYLPGLRMSDPIATESITPRDLVTHRSGLPRHDLAWYNTRLTGKDVFARLAHFEPTEPLRAKFQYNNMMFMLAGYLVEKVDGRPWEEAVRARIFGPLGMDSSNFSVLDSQKSDDFARPYDEQEGKVRVIPFRDITSVGPAGSINSSVAEMARWVAVHTHGGKLDGKAIISPAVLAELHTPQMTLGQPSSKKEISPGSYAMGWMTDTYRGHRRVHHGGGIDGFTANTCLFPDDGMGLVVLTNKDGTPLPELITRHASDRLLSLEPIDWLAEGLEKRNKALDAQKEAKKKKESVRRPGTRPAHPLEEYAGDYEHPGYGAFTGRAPRRQAGRHLQRHRGHARPLALRGLQRPQGRQRPGAGRHQLEDPVPDQRQGGCGRGRRAAGAERQADRLRPAARQEALRPRVPQAVRGRVRAGRRVRHVRLQGHVLILKQADAPPVELVPDRDDEFGLKKQAGVSIRFVTGPAGRVTEMAVSTDDGVFTARRKS